MRIYLDKMRLARILAEHYRSDHDFESAEEIERALANGTIEVSADSDAGEVLLVCEYEESAGTLT